MVVFALLHVAKMLLFSVKNVVHDRPAWWKEKQSWLFGDFWYVYIYIIVPQC